MTDRYVNADKFIDSLGSSDEDIYCKGLIEDFIAENPDALCDTTKREPMRANYTRGYWLGGTSIFLYDVAECPNCGHEFKSGDGCFEDVPFCPFCGQPIKWGLRDDETD